MIALIAREGGASERSHFTVDGPGVITLLLKRNLNTGHDLIRRKPVVAVDRLVVLILRVGIVTPGRIPPAVIPTPPAKIEKDDGGATMPPPVRAVMMMTIVDVVQARLGSVGDISVPIPETARRLRIEFVFGGDVNGRRVLQIGAAALKRARTVQIVPAGKSRAMDV